MSASTDRIDLHIHSTCSDGMLTPRQVVDLAKTAGLCAVALTDHDTVAGIPEALAAGVRVGVEVVAGVEVSALHAPGSMHILGYYLSLTHTELAAVLERLQNGRAARTLEIIHRLKTLGLEITLGEVLRLASGQVGRTHIARVLVNRGYVDSVAEAFDRYLKKGRPGYVGRLRLPAEETIGVFRRAGGLAVLAHPSSLALDRPRDVSALVERLKAMGLEGIEVFSPYHTREMTTAYKDMACRYGLLCTGGSDFHGGLSDRANLGAAGAGLHVPYALLEGLKERIGGITP
jgi:predicted metal-dependent phosphoesterase TrpH